MTTPNLSTGRLALKDGAVPVLQQDATAFPKMS